MTVISLYREKAVITVTAVTKRKTVAGLRKQSCTVASIGFVLPTKPAAQPRGAKGPYNPINKEDEYMRKREVGINIRVTETEKRKLELNARRCKLSLSAYLRKLGFGYAVQVLPQKELYQIYKAVSYLENDLDELSKGQIREHLQDIKSKLLEVYLSESQGDDDGSYEDLAD